MGFIEIDDGDEANPTQRKPVVIVYGAQGSDDDGFDPRRYSGHKASLLSLTTSTSPLPRLVSSSRIKC